jgi:hypothetical protein
MDFAHARDFKVTFGMHAGKTVDQIGSTDRGLLYLDWYRADCAERELPPTRALEAISSYLDDPAIAGDLMKLVRP